MLQRAHSLSWLASFLFAAFLLAAGCGRSDIGIDLLPGGDSGLPDGGDGGACTPATCATGCCQGDVCQTGTAATACGNGGNACTTCAPGLNCDPASQQCTTGGCSAINCFGGCCDATGACQPGTSPLACGDRGQSCLDCSAQGFAQCATNGSAHLCETNVNHCDPGTCPNGCCQPNGGGGAICVDGNQDMTCGSGGMGCQDCANAGAVCDPNAHQCVPPTCGPNNCSGCCLGDVCVPGNTQNSCGAKGQQCQNCGNGTCSNGTCETTMGCGPQTCPGCCNGNTCLSGQDTNACGQGGQQCFACPPNATCFGGSCGIVIDAGGCGPNNCPGCCDANGLCEQGQSTNACGQGGQLCNPCPPGFACQGGFCFQQPDSGACGPTNCKGCCDFNGTCQTGQNPGACGQGGQQCNVCPPNSTCGPGGMCQAQVPCTAANCLGCCDANNFCQGGFVDTGCGSGGAQCTDCTQQGSTCDVNVKPRTCTSNQTQCPAPYPGCPAGTTTVPHPIQNVCTASDLQNAQAACSPGATSASCQAYFQFEKQQNPACYGCLLPFDVRFFDFTGIFLCVAPYVDPTCDQNTGCASDCVNQSCSQCTSGQGSCKQTVEQGQCNPYFQNIGCVFQQGFQGQGFFCDPQQYNGNFGSWLQAVGQNYCAQ